MQFREREVAEEGSVAGAEDGGEKAGLAREDRVAEGVDAAVDAVQATGGDSPVDLAVDEAGGEQLDQRDEAALAGREGCDDLVRGGGVAADLLY